MTKTFVSAGELLYDVCMNEFLVQNSDIIVRLVVAMCLGMLIGAERVLVHKEAGMKTHALVAMGSAVFVLISEAFVEKYMALPGLNPGIICPDHSGHWVFGCRAHYASRFPPFRSYYGGRLVGNCRHRYGSRLWTF